MAVQDRLRVFYIGAYIHLAFEAIGALLWIAAMFTLKFGMGRLEGAQYRLTNVLMLLHLTTPLVMLGIVQQAKNRNSVGWWSFFAFFIALFGDLETLLELAIKNVSKAVPWAWSFLLALAILNLTLTSFAIVWYLLWYRKLPRPAGIKKMPPPRNDQHYYKL